MPDVRHGGCLCGAIRYECRDKVQNLVVCHCTDCRKAYGAAAGYNARVATDSLQMTQGAPKAYVVTAQRGQPLTRMFCGDCGTRSFSQRANLPAAITLKVGTLDDPSGLREGVHIWTSSAVPWLHLDPKVRQHERNFPELSPANINPAD